MLRNFTKKFEWRRFMIKIIFNVNLKLDFFSLLAEKFTFLSDDLYYVLLQLQRIPRMKKFNLFEIIFSSIFYIVLKDIQNYLLIQKSNYFKNQKFLFDSVSRFDSKSNILESKIFLFL